MNENAKSKRSGSDVGTEQEPDSSDRRAEKRIDGILTDIEDTTYSVLRKHDKKPESAVD